MLAAWLAGFCALPVARSRSGPALVDVARRARSHPRSCRDRRARCRASRSPFVLAARSARRSARRGRALRLRRARRRASIGQPLARPRRGRRAARRRRPVPRRARAAALRGAARIVAAVRRRATARAARAARRARAAGRWLHGRARRPRSRFRYDGDVRRMTVEALGDPWTPGDLAPARRRCRALGARRRRSRGPTSRPRRSRRSPAAGGCSLDGQGLVRAPRSTGPLELDADFDPEVLRARRDAQARRGGGATRSPATLDGGAARARRARGRCSRSARAARSSSRRRRVERVPAQPVDGVDPTGAGDAFCVAYVSRARRRTRPRGAARAPRPSRARVAATLLAAIAVVRDRDGTCAVDVESDEVLGRADEPALEPAPVAPRSACRASSRRPRRARRSSPSSTRRPPLVVSHDAGHDLARGGRRPPAGPRGRDRRGRPRPRRSTPPGTASTSRRDGGRFWQALARAAGDRLRSALITG